MFSLENIGYLHVLRLQPLQVHNDDGVWLRLSADSIKEWCNNGFTDAWCLQYNQHLGKTLLVPLDEPKSMMEEILGETIRKIQTYSPKPAAQPQPPPGRSGI